jgi:hypothetical protein
MSSNNRSYSTNRFLSKTNPQFIRGLADSGSVLDSPEINKLAAQMVDLGIWDDLKLWVHEGLVKERVSGTDVFVENAYDISGNNYDYSNINTAQQPQLLTGFYSTDATRMDMGAILDGLSAISIVNWVKFDTVANGGTDAGTINGMVTKARNAATSFNITDYDVRYDRRTSEQKLYFIVNNATNSPLTINVPNVPSVMGTNWNMVTCTWRSSGTPNQQIYTNNVLRESSNLGVNNMRTSSETLKLNGSNDNRQLNGQISDIRIFERFLTATEIDAIFQATRGKYGL